MSEIKSYVIVSLEGGYIDVNRDPLRITPNTNDMVNPPDHTDSIKSIVWDVSYGNHPTHKGVIIFYNNYDYVFFDDEKYNDWVKPYVDIWQAKKDEQQQQEEEAQQEYMKFENRQARALTQLNADFETAKQRSHIVSSLGFTVDANQTANENVTGLLVTIGDTETVQFCDYHNQFHELTKANLQVLQTEIIANAQNLYQQKWVYRTQIEQCGNNEQLDEVTVGIKFTYMDFTPIDEGDAGEQSQ